MMQASRQRAEQIDSEYQTFMSEIGGGSAVKYASNVSDPNSNLTPEQQQQQMMIDPAQLQQYYAAMMQQWDPSTFTQNWSIPPPAPPQ